MGPASEPNITGASTIDLNSPLARALEGASKERRAIFELLVQRAWFQRSSQELQVELAMLPDDAAKKNTFNGYLMDLAERPERISNVQVLSLQKIARGNFAVISMFDVQSEAGTKFTYEYVSWKHGPMSGWKGLVLIEASGKPTHFIVLRGEKFATGKRETDSVGGFADLNSDGVLKAVDRIKREIQEELGLAEVKFAREPIDLGPLCIDPGMTNNRPGLFIASIDASEATRLQKDPINSDPYELSSSVSVYPIDQLKEVVSKNQDSFFLACVSRAWALGILS